MPNIWVAAAAEVIAGAWWKIETEGSIPSGPLAVTNKLLLWNLEHKRHVFQKWPGLLSGVPLTWILTLGSQQSARSPGAASGISGREEDQGGLGCQQVIGPRVTIWVLTLAMAEDAGQGTRSPSFFTGLGLVRWHCPSLLVTALAVFCC